MKFSSLAWKTYAFRDGRLKRYMVPFVFSVAGHGMKIRALKIKARNAA
jgi:hypothetical protein